MGQYRGLASYKNTGPYGGTTHHFPDFDSLPEKGPQHRAQKLFEKPLWGCAASLLPVSNETGNALSLKRSGVTVLPYTVFAYRIAVTFAKPLKRGTGWKEGVGSSGVGSSGGPGLLVLTRPSALVLPSISVCAGGGVMSTQSPKRWREQSHPHTTERGCTVTRG